MKVQIITVEEAERREREKPGYLAALKVCAGDPVDGMYKVDREAPCYLLLPWALPVKSRGVGDLIAKFTHAAGVLPCGGCADRQVTFNAALPIRRDA